MSLPVTIEQSTCCVPRITASITPEEAERSARVFKAIGDPTRVRVLPHADWAPAFAGASGVCGNLRL